MNKKVLALLLTLCMLFTMVPVNVMAEEADGNGLTEMSLQDSSTDESTDISADDETVPENEGEENNNAIDLSGGSKTIETPGEYTVVANAATTNTLTVKADATITLKNLTVNAGADASAISIESGNVTLIISGEVSLTGGDNGAGIYVAEGASVTIKDSGAEDDKLTAIGNAGADDANGAAGIGGTWANGNSGAITIDGATVIARGYGVHGSGIGSGSGKVVGEIKINDANVTAQGSYYADGAGTKLQSKYGKSDPEGGAAIGGGGKTASTIADITITDSTVVANGGSKAAGIGANFWCSCGTITISGDSNVTAQGGSSSAGIGTSRAGDTGVSAKIVISGGTVNATGGAYGAGIGGGYNSDSLGNGAEVSALPEISVTVSGGNVTATGGEGGAGIGGGYKTDNVDIDITGGTITAVTGALVSGKTVENGGEACAIGSGANGSGKFENSPAVEIGSAASITVTTEYGGKPAVEGMTDENANDLNNVVVTVNNAPAVTYVAQVGETKHETLAAAVEAAEAGATVTLLGDTEGAGIVINKDITIDLAGYTYTFVTPAVGSEGTKSQCFQILKDNTVVIKNGKLNVAEAAKAEFAMLIQNYADLTLTDVVLDGTNLDRTTYSYVVSNNSGNVVINGNTSILANDSGDAYAFDVYDYSSAGYTIPNVTVNTTGTITGVVEVSANLVVNGGIFTSTGDVFVVTSGKLTINNATVTANTDGTGTANAIWANGGAVEINDGTFSVGGDTEAADKTHQNDAIYTKNGGTVVINGGEFRYTEGVWTLNENDANRGTITVCGGTFVGFNPADNVSEGEDTSFVAEGYIAHVDNDDDTYCVVPEVIEIYDWEDLKELDALVESGCMLEGVTVKLMNNIDLYEMGTDGEPVSFNPIGANSAYFKGTFDGQGHTIKNMYQSGWALGYDWDHYGTIGMFAYLWDATVKNVTIENAECFVEGGNVAGIAGCAWGDCTFENITIKNSTYATYNNRAAGIVGYTGGEGTMTFKNVTVDKDTVIAGLWGSFDSTLGGVVGSTQSPTKFNFKDVTVECKLDCYNDVTASYKWYSYRMCGMLIGRMGTLQTDAPTEVDPRGVVTIDNVNITIGEWANQTYIWDDSLSKGCQRVEAGYSYGGVDVSQYPDAEVTSLGFSTIIGGPQSGSKGYYGSDVTKLKALERFDASTLYVNDIALEIRSRVAQVGDEYFTSLQAAINAANDGPITLLRNTTEENITITDGATVVIDLGGNTLNGYIAPCNPASLTISNGAIKNTNDGYSAIEINEGVLNLTNVNIDSARHAVRIDGAVTATINGGTYVVKNNDDKTVHAVNASGAANVTIENGTFIGPKGTAANSGAAVNVQTGATVTIENGNFSGGKNNTLAADGTLTVKGGTFDQDPTAYVADGYRAVKSGDNWTVKEIIVLSGSGTETDPYLITNLKELKAFRDYVNEGNTYADKYVKLTADIDLTGEVWTPIGTSNYDKTPTTEGVKMFAGNFDGGNHTITGLTSDGYVPDSAETGSTEYSFGLFGYVYGANISNVTLANVDINCGTRTDSAGNTVYGSGIAALIGYYVPANEKTSVISNCHVLSGTVKASNNMGGLIGHMDSQLSQPEVDITIENCSNAANVTTEAREAGGILGLMNSAREGNYLVTMRGTVTFKNCVNTGDITSLGGGAPSAGGILGRDHNQAAGQRLKIVFDGCENSGTITVTANGETHAAGIGAGYYSVGAWLIAKDCNNTGNVVVNNSNSEVYAGGLISYGGVVELINSTSTGTVTGGTANNTYVGGAQNILFLEKMPNFTDTVNGYTYYLNGGTSPEYAALVDDAAGGGNFHLVETASKDGFEFGGWYDNAGFTGEAYTALNNNVKTYYAKWIGPVAKIGDTKYDTLQLAIDAVQAGETVTLITDVAEEIQIANNATVVLDLNGKTLTGCFKPFNGNLTVYGGTIDNNNGSYSAIEITAGTLDIKDVNITSTRHGVRIDGAVTATIDGGTYKVDATSGTRHAVNVSGAANVTIKNGTFIGPKGTAMDSGAAVMVQSGATVTIESGNFSGGKNNTLAADGTLTVKGGTYDQNPTAYVAKGYKAVDNGDGNYTVAPNMIFKLHLTDPATGEPATIPYLEGNDLASLIATGKAFYANYYEMTLEILDDCVIDETVVIDYPMTIDLKGNTITGDGNVLPLIRIVGDADVTVKNGEIANDSYVFILGASDGSSAGNLTIESGKYTGETTVASVTKGTLTVLDGEFAVTNDATYLLNCIDANYKDGSAKIVVKGGTFYNFNPADNASEGVGTNFVAKGYKAVDNGNGTYGVEPNMIFEAHLVDANGEAHWLSPMRGNELNDLLEKSKVWYDSLQGTYDFTIKILEDCEIDETVVIDFPLTLDLGGKTITIADGKVLKTSGNLTVTGEGTIIGELSLTSATATLKAPADLTVNTNVENGIVKYIDGTYKVIPAVAQVGETIYATVSEALTEAAKTGATVTLIANADADVVVVYPGVTLDLNGNTLNANYVVGLNGSDVIDSSADNTGLLVVENKVNVELAKDNDQLPVWDDDFDGYLFVEIEYKTRLDSDPVNETIKQFRFNVQKKLDWEALYTRLADNGAGDHELSVIVEILWSNGEEANVTQRYVYKEGIVIAMSSGQLAAEEKYGNYSCKLDEGDRKNVTYSVIFVSGTGAEFKYTHK